MDANKPNGIMRKDTQLSETAPRLAQRAEALVRSAVDVPVLELEGRQTSVPLTHYLWILKHHCWRILGFVLVCLLATLIVSLRLTPIYEATATIDVDRQTPTGIIGQDAMRATLNDADQFLSTQVRLIQSDSVLRPVVQQFGLLEDEEEGAKTPASGIGRAEAPTKLRNLSVTRPPNTYLMLISYRASDPYLVAEVANAIANSYIAHTFDLRYKASASLTGFMERQLEELKAKMERSSEALGRYERELNVINPEERTSILSARLLQLNTEFTNAQVDRGRKEAATHSLQTGSIDSALSSPQGESLRKLNESLNQAHQNFAIVRSQYGANHPEYKKSAIELAEIERLVESTHASIARRVEGEYSEARDREEILRTEVAEAKSEFDELTERSFEYQQLKREAEADKTLYDDLVRRIREAGINSSFENSSIRLADLARPAMFPVSPNIPLNLALAFLFSTALALCTALVYDSMDDTVRDPDEVQRSMNTVVIGGLPTVRGWRKRIGQNANSGSGEPLNQAAAAFTESVRTLRNAILLSDFDRRIRTLLVTSAAPSEGKSTVACHLAMAHANQGKRTLLVDGDLRRPSLHHKFDFSATEGMTNVLLEEMNWRQAVVQPTDSPFLDLLPSGSSSRRALDLLGPSITDLLHEWSREYDLVIIDAPPLPGFPEPLQMATDTDATLIVARSGKTSRRAVASVVSSLQRLRVNLLGIVLNELRQGQAHSYYYSNYYGYTANTEVEEKSLASAAR